jgi:16S rRNA (guanine(966)-N(2))-methyltransferase RsmD
MRVIGGLARGRKLQSVPGDSTRPILDRVKTALFDILRPRLAGWRVLDVFAGSGGVGIEALSQGASHCTFLDLNANAIATIRANLENVRMTSQAEVRQTDAFSYLKKTNKSFDLIFVAPPQYKALWIEAMHIIAERPALLNPGGLIIAQIDPKEYELLSLSAFQELRQNKYGNTLLVFYGTGAIPEDSIAADAENPGPGSGTDDE